MSILIAYGTVEGQTGKIARFISDRARSAGHEVVLFDTGDRTGALSFKEADTVVLAASVHERRHPKPFEVFVSANRENLAQRRVLLLSVSLNAAFDDFRDEAQDYLDELKLRTGLEPDEELLVAGAVRPESYDYYASQVLRHVVLGGKDVDPGTRAHEFTDWDALAEKLDAFLAKMPARRGG